MGIRVAIVAASSGSHVTDIVGTISVVDAAGFTVAATHPVLAVQPGSAITGVDTGLTCNEVIFTNTVDSIAVITIRAIGIVVREAALVAFVLRGVACVLVHTIGVLRATSAPKIAANIDRRGLVMTAILGDAISILIAYTAYIQVGITIIGITVRVGLTIAIVIYVAILIANIITGIAFVQGAILVTVTTLSAYRTADIVLAMETASAITLLVAVLPSLLVQIAVAGFAMVIRRTSCVIGLLAGFVTSKGDGIAVTTQMGTDTIGGGLAAASAATAATIDGGCLVVTALKAALAVGILIAGTTGIQILHAQTAVAVIAVQTDGIVFSGTVGIAIKEVAFVARCFIGTIGILLTARPYIITAQVHGWRLLITAVQSFESAGINAGALSRVHATGTYSRGQQALVIRL